VRGEFRCQLLGLNLVSLEGWLSGIWQRPQGFVDSVGLMAAMESGSFIGKS
jgi:hypothetical protein